MFGWLCRATYQYLLFCCIYFDAWCITCCPKRQETLEVCTEWYLVAYVLCLLWCLVYHMLFKTRRNSGSWHRVIREVLVLGLLVVAYNIPYSCCFFNTAVVVACVLRIYSWFLPMSWILDLSILLSICRAYIYVRPVTLIYLFYCTYLLQCLVYHILSKTRSSGNLHRVIGEVLVVSDRWHVSTRRHPERPVSVPILLYINIEIEALWSQNRETGTTL